MSALLQTDSHYVTAKQAEMSHRSVLAPKSDRRYIKLQWSDWNKYVDPRYFTQSDEHARSLNV